jgi:DNA-binding XRE family transcriptional regulator
MSAQGHCHVPVGRHAIKLGWRRKGATGAADIGVLFAEFEAMAGGQAALTAGRQWLAEAFYGGRPVSLAQLRLRRGWSQAELARRVETSQPYIARLEAGRVDPQLSTVRRIASALEVSTATLVDALDQRSGD